MSSIADNLRTIRTLNHITQAELSRLSNVSKTYINRIEKGIYTNVSIDILSRLAEALGCTVNDINGPFKLEKRANSTIDTMLLNNDPECSVSTLILSKLLKEKIIDENFKIDDELKETLEEAIKLDARVNNNLRKKGSAE